MRQLTVGIDHPFPIDLAFLPGSRRLLGVVGCSLVLWDLDANTCLPSWVDEFRGLLFRFAASPCGRYAAGAEDRCLVLWDLDARKPGKWLVAGDGEHIADVAFSPDGKEVLTVLLEGGGVVRRRVGSWRKKPGFGSSPGWLGGRPAFFDGHLAVSRDYRTLATSHCQKGEGGLFGIKLWELPGGIHRRTVTSGPDSINQLAFSPDGRVLAVQHEYRRVSLYDANTLALLAEHTPQLPRRRKAVDAVMRIAFHPDGRLLAASGDTSVTLVEAGSLRPVQAFDWGIGRTFGVAFSSDGTLAAVSGEKGQVVVWDVG